MTCMTVICYVLAPLPAEGGQCLAWLLILTWFADLIAFEVLRMFSCSCNFSL